VADSEPKLCPSRYTDLYSDRDVTHFCEKPLGHDGTHEDYEWLWKDEKEIRFVADSEVRQKFEAYFSSDPNWFRRRDDGNYAIPAVQGAYDAFAAGMRAGEIAQLDALLNELSSKDFALHSTDGDIAYSAIGEWLLSKRRALPAAPEEKKPALSGAEESKK
jgi:hypothetical protein